ncbi:MAG: response regulator [Candidatus Omnitrophota bacterium]
MKKILIVEDDKLLASALKIMLEGSGFEAIVALEGYYAIQRAHKDRPDLIITDLGLPAGDGFRIIKTLKESADLMSIPAIIITGKNDQETIAKIETLGVAAYFIKPFDHKALLNAVKKATGGGT